MQAPAPPEPPPPPAAAAEAAQSAEARAATSLPPPPAAAAAVGFGPAWDLLQPEIVQQILQQIPPKSFKAPPGLCLASATCRPWHAAAAGCRGLHVVFSYGLWHPGHWSDFLVWVRRYACSIQQLEVRLRWTHVEDARLGQLLDALEEAAAKVAARGPLPAAAAAAAGGAGGSSGRGATGGDIAAAAAAAKVAAMGPQPAAAGGGSSARGQAAAAASGGGSGGGSSGHSGLVRGPTAAAAVAAARDYSISSSSSSRSGPYLPHLQSFSYAISGPSVWSMPLAARLLRLAPNLRTVDLAVRIFTPGELLLAVDLQNRQELQQLCAALSSHSQLTQLSLQVSTSPAEGSDRQTQQGNLHQVLAALPPQLEVLKVTGLLPGPEQDYMARLDGSELTHLRGLRELHLQHNRLGGTESLAALPALTSITLQHTVDSLEGLAPVVGKVKCMEYVDSVSPGDLTALTGLTSFKPADAMHQPDYSWMPQLQRLLVDVSVPALGVAALHQCRVLTGLTSLYVAAGSWDETPAPALAALTQLKELTLSPDWLSHPAPWAAAVKQLPGLERLTMHQDLLEHGGTWLTGLTALTWLQLQVTFPAKPAQVYWPWSSGSDIGSDGGDSEESSRDSEGSSRGSEGSSNDGEGGSSSSSSGGNSSGRSAQGEQAGEAAGSSSVEAGAAPCQLDAALADMQLTAGGATAAAPVGAGVDSSSSSSSSSGQGTAHCATAPPAAAGTSDEPQGLGGDTHTPPGDTGSGSPGDPGDTVSPGDAPQAPVGLPCMLLEEYAVAHVAAWLGEQPLEQREAATAAAAAPTAAAAAAAAAAAVPATQAGGAAGDTSQNFATTSAAPGATAASSSSSRSGGVCRGRRVVLRVAGWLEEEDVGAAAAALALLRGRLPGLQVHVEGFDL